MRTVRLGLSNLKFPHDELNIHHTMHEVMTLEYASLVARCGTLSLASGQVMNLTGNRRRPKRTQRFIGANAGSPTGRESHGDGTPIVLRPCGIEVSASRMRHHWSNVIKAASYLHRHLYRDTFTRKSRGDKSMV